MAWGKTQTEQQAPAKDKVNVEFEVEGRTYQVELDSVAWVPYYYANQQSNTVSVTTDLLTGEEIMVVWNKIGVLRKVAATPTT